MSGVAECVNMSEVSYLVVIKSDQQIPVWWRNYRCRVVICCGFCFTDHAHCDFNESSWKLRQLVYALFTFWYKLSTVICKHGNQLYVCTYFWVRESNRLLLPFWAGLHWYDFRSAVSMLTYYVTVYEINKWPTTERGRPVIGTNCKGTYYKNSGSIADVQLCRVIWGTLQTSLS